jgi:hypothetical protein
LESSPIDPLVGTWSEPIGRARDPRHRAINGRDATWSEALIAPLSGSILLSGSLAAPEAIASLHAPALSFRGVPLGPLAVSAGLDPHSDERVFVDLRLPAQQTEVRWGFGDATANSLRVAAMGLRLGELAPLAGLSQLSGSATLRAEVAGPWSALSGSASLEIDALGAAGLRLERTRVEAGLTAGTAKVRGSLFNGLMEVSLQTQLAADMPFSAEVRFENLPLHRALAVAALRIQGSGSVFAQGYLARPDSITADLQVPLLAVEWREFRLRNEQPIQLQYGGGVIDVVHLQMQGHPLRLAAAGRAHVGGPLQLQLAFGGDAAVLQSVSGLGQAFGAFEGDLSISGPWTDPLLHGGVTLAGLTLGVPALPSPVEEITGKVLVRGRQITLQEIRGRSGHGQLAADGTLLLAAGSPPLVDLRARFDKVRSSPMAGLDLTLSGELGLVGPADDLFLKGSVRIAELAYTKNIELDVQKLLPAPDRPLQVPSVVTGSPTQLQVSVTAPGKLFIRTDQVEAELKADLALVGNTDRIGLLGNVVPLGGIVRYRDLTLKLAGGSVDFIEEFRVRAQYNLDVEGQGCEMDMALNVRGDSEGAPSVLASGRDERGPVESLDVLNCITYGTRASDFASAGSTGSTQEAGLGEALGGGLDLLWGVSGLGRQVKRVLPYFDHVRLTSGPSGRTHRMAPRMVLIKQVGKRMELRYDLSLGEAGDHIVSMEYDLSRVAKLEGSWVSVSEVPVGDLGLDLRLRWELD